MKKSRLALGVIAVFGAAWTGAAYYTGSVAETELKRQMEYLNQQSAAQSNQFGIETKIANVQVERGVFSSSYRYDVIVQTKNDQMTIPTEGVIYHGPLPLNQLKKGNLLPAMFAATGQLVKNEYTQAIFDSAQGKNPFTSEVSMSYAQRMTGVMNVAQSELKSADLNLAWSDASIHFDTDKNGVGSYETKIPKLNMQLNLKSFDKLKHAKNLESIQIALENVKSFSNTQPTSFKQLFTGTGRVEIGTLKYHFTGTNQQVEDIGFEQVTVEANANLDKDFIDYGLKLSLGDMLLNHKPFGKLTVNAQLNHLAANTVNALFETAPDNQAEYQRLGLELLQNQPHFVVAPLIYRNEKGEMKADLNIEMASADFTKALSGKVLSLFKQLSVNLEMDKAALIHQESLKMQAEGNTAEEADKLAERYVASALTQAVQYGVFTENEKSVKLSLGLENNGLNFNGNHIPEKEIGMILMMLMMNGFK